MWNKEQSKMPPEKRKQYMLSTSRAGIAGDYNLLFLSLSLSSLLNKHYHQSSSHHHLASALQNTPLTKAWWKDSQFFASSPASYVYAQCPYYPMSKLDTCCWLPLASSLRKPWLFFQNHYDIWPGQSISMSAPWWGL